ncbi:hypothetical protein [Thermococcus celer]|uniref:Phosphatidate cytidylyltransferase n=1 Tax=Thermococcus celer Vu 13 = JCM 8558 TaxID=1293037 RepID=A0A218P457_THECE|nr:hypothetical protein [Thermococcus celer]ASI99693.1 hypothetical protein A3L02_09035 [Thermococcus celer Vu 13 = JCM 8558]
MRRLFVSLAFLLPGTFYIAVNFRPDYLAAVLLGWLTFALEYRYGSKGKAEEELVAVGVSTPMLLLPLNATLAEALVASVFVIELAVLMFKFKPSRS